jgi:hypothetical protein
LIEISGNHAEHLLKYHACRDVSLQCYEWCAPWSYSILVLVILVCSLLVYYDLPSWIVGMVSGNLDQIIMTVHDLANSPNRNEPVGGMLLYFSKAFDKVSQQKLLDKLSYYEVRGYLHSWTKDFL